MPRSAFPILVVLGMGWLSGCGDAPKMVVGESRKDHMVEIGEMIKSLAEEGRSPPSKMAELEAVEPMLPLSGPLVRTGEIVYLWGAAYAPGSTRVVAYEKKAPAEGGWVVLQDGSVREMTADEFKSAPWAK